MKKFVLATLLLMVVLSSEGRVAWYGEREFESSVESLREEGYTIEYVAAADKRTLSVYDVLVISLVEPSPKEKEQIMDFVEKGGGLLIIYDVALHPTVEGVLAEYELKKTSNMENELIYSLLSEEIVQELKKRIAFSQKGRGRIIVIGYDPLTSQALTLLRGENTIFMLGLDWLCQDWHVKQTQELLTQRRMKTLVPIAVLAVLAVLGYYIFVFRKKKKEREEKGEEKGKLKAGSGKKSDTQEQIRELKARFVYGELSRDEYHRELERLESQSK